MNKPHPFSNYFTLFDLDGQQSLSQDVTCALRQEADVVAVCAHLLGYWPENALVFLTLRRDQVGPILRVDLADSPALDPTDYLRCFLTQLPFHLPSSNPLIRFFAIFFQPHTKRQAPAGKGKDRCLIGSRESDFLTLVRPFIRPLQGLADRLSLDLIDALAVGESYIWSLREETGTLYPAMPTGSVRTSQPYRELSRAGSSVSASRAGQLNETAWNPLTTASPAARDHWFTCAELASTDYLMEVTRQSTELQLRQIIAELPVWDAALEQCAQALIDHRLAAPENRCRSSESASSETEKKPDTRQVLADRLRQILTSDGAAYLAASLNNTATLQFVLYLACTDLPTAQTLLRDLDRQLCPGTSPTAPVFTPVLPHPSTLEGYGLSPTYHLDGEAPVTSSPTSDRGSHDSPLSIMSRTLCGRTHREPHWARLAALNAISQILEHLTQGRQESFNIITQAWIFWLRGQSTAASALLETTNPLHYINQSMPLPRILDLGLIPLWLTQPYPPETDRPETP